MGENPGMDDAFLIVVVVVSLLGLAGAIIALATSGGSYDSIGRGGLSIGEDRPARPAGAGAGPAGTAAERDDEIRQLLAARNARRAARGEPTVDVDAELAALTAPAADPELAAEVRQLVEARNARRLARGQAPLDVELEVSRRLREL
jgi:hypothetical protein